MPGHTPKEVAKRKSGNPNLGPVGKVPKRMPTPKRMRRNARRGKSGR